jgi:hypothetical protein
MKRTKTIQKIYTYDYIYEQYNDCHSLIRDISKNDGVMVLVRCELDNIKNFFKICKYFNHKKIILLCKTQNDKENIETPIPVNVINIFITPDDTLFYENNTILKKMNKNELSDKISTFKIFSPIIKVHFMCSWNDDINNLYKYFTPKNSGKWNNIMLTNFDDAQIIIILEKVKSDKIHKLLNCNKKIIYIKTEEETYRKFTLDFMKDCVIESIIRHKDMFYASLYEHFTATTYDDFIDMKIPKKNKLLSVIVSRNMTLDGHKKRVNFIKKLSSRFPNMIDIYGKGWTSEELGNNYKGELGNYHVQSNTGTTKKDGLINYKYSIAIENCIEKNCFTEKFNDPILCWTIPIYYGCNEINNFFPEKSYVKINIDNFDETCNIITNILTESLDFDNTQYESLKYARYLVLNSYNISNLVEKHINNNFDIEKTRKNIIQNF